MDSGFNREDRKVKICLQKTQRERERDRQTDRDRQADRRTDGRADGRTETNRDIEADNQEQLTGKSRCLHHADTFSWTERHGLCHHQLIRL